MTIIGRLGTAAVVAIAACAPSRTAFAQAAPGDHWTFVPALATSCFPDDDFLGKVGAATNAINAEVEKQEKINAAAKEKFDNMDMMEKAQRMQAFMMKNPQAAMKMLQAEQAAGATATSAVVEGNEDVKPMLAELERLRASLRTALELAVKPVHARQEALIQAKTVLAGEAQISTFTNAADYAQYEQLIAEENAAIEKACAPFFGANGSFHTWLARWRTEVTEKMITAGGDATDIVVMQMAAMDLPGGGYRSTNSLTQVRNHLHQIQQVYGVRPNRVQPKIGLKK